VNAALALVQLKEFTRNEERRKQAAEVFAGALMQGRHTQFPVTDGSECGAYCFAVLLAGGSGFKDVKNYCARKNIEIEPAFAGCVSERFPDESASCINARSLFLRTARFPLYPRLSSTDAAAVRKALAALP